MEVLFVVSDLERMTFLLGSFFSGFVMVAVVVDFHLCNLGLTSV